MWCIFLLKLKNGLRMLLSLKKLNVWGNKCIEHYTMFTCMETTTGATKIYTNFTCQLKIAILILKNNFLKT